MAHYSVHVSNVQRSRGQNAVASAAYNSRSKLSMNVFDKESGTSTELSWDYCNKVGLVYSKIHAPDNAPEWVYDREKLWNKAERAENRCDARPAQKIMLALPKELTLEQNTKLLEEVVGNLVKMGMIVDANVHNDNMDNPHAHLMMSVRELKLNRYDEVEFSPLKNREWCGPKYVRFVREMICNVINKHYGLNGYDQRVTNKSYAELGIDLIPGIHNGPANYIKASELTQLNREIAIENAERIQENPGIILDLLAMNYPVFTKEQIAAELEKRLSAGIDFSKIENIEDLNKKSSYELSGIFTVAYEKILNSPELTLVTNEDLKGRTLYTTTKRIKLEERFIENVKAMNSKSSHTMDLTNEALDHLSFREHIVERVRDVASKAASRIEDRIGIKLEIPKAPSSLSVEQRQAVVNVLNGSNICVLEGIPGAGKTTAMREIVRQYKKAGKTVIGIAPSSSASLELARATGIECKNGSLWRKTWMEEEGKKFELVLRGDYYKEKQYEDKEEEFGAKQSLTRDHVLIIDEASMVELANMDYFLSKARSVGAKVVLVGDNNQLSPVGWAGGLGKVIQICGSERLEESRRQRSLSHQEATKLLGQYRVRDALDIFWREGNISVSGNAAEANSKCVSEFIESYVAEAKQVKADNLISTRNHVIGVFENKTRDVINASVREQLKEAGVLKGKEHNIWVGAKGGEKRMLSLMRGEQIVFARNYNKLGKKGVFNGELGTVLKIREVDHDNISGHKLAVIDILVHKTNGKKEKVSLDLNELANTKHFEGGLAIEHGYAVTAHKLQGASVDNVSVVLEKGVGFEVFNVLATRHKENVKFYVDKELLEASFYEALDESVDRAKNRFELKLEGNVERIEKGGLAKLIPCAVKLGHLWGRYKALNLAF